MQGEMVVTEQQPATATENTSREALGTEFERQVEKLIDAGYPEAAGINLRLFIHMYIEPLRLKVRNLIVPKRNGHIPILLVVPAQIVTLPEQMSMVRIDDSRIGHMHINVALIRDKEGGRVRVPNEPYLITDVETGIATRGVSGEKCLELFKKEQRHGLTAEEGLAILTQFPETLGNKGELISRSVNLPCSSFGQDSMLSLWVDRKGAWLGCVWADTVEADRGSASRKCRITS